MKREIVITEQTDLHLTWYKSTIYIKPFPRYLGSHEFWTAHLCELKELHETACGFVFSYTWLISCESDFDLAMKLNILDDKGEHEKAEIMHRRVSTMKKNALVKIHSNMLLNIYNLTKTVENKKQNEKIKIMYQ